MFNSIRSILIIGGYISIFFVLINILNSYNIFSPIIYIFSLIFPDLNPSIFASFLNGITIGENALAAAEFLDKERRIAFAACEEYGRKKRMQELMAVAYAKAEEIYKIKIKLM